MHKPECNISRLSGEVNGSALFILRKRGKGCCSPVSRGGYGSCGAAAGPGTGGRGKFWLKLFGAVATGRGSVQFFAARCGSCCSSARKEPLLFSPSLLKSTKGEERKNDMAFSLCRLVESFSESEEPIPHDSCFRYCGRTGV